jgi:hypothetical protein
LLGKRGAWNFEFFKNISLEPACTVPRFIDKSKNLVALAADCVGQKLRIKAFIWDNGLAVLPKRNSVLCDTNAKFRFKRHAAYNEKD